MRTITFFTVILLFLIPTLTFAAKSPVKQKIKGTSAVPKWGTIVNREHQNELIRGIFFFAGPPNPASLSYYTRNPLHREAFSWRTNKDISLVFDQIKGGWVLM